MFWSQEEIETRNMFVEHMVSAVRKSLLSMNQAFKMIQCEAPILTPIQEINKNYSTEDFYAVPEDSKSVGPISLTLRPETTMGSYAYARHILSGYHVPKFKLPICIWQHGKSFRKEQDQPTKFMRLKEFYQLEFQILFAANTANDYYPDVVLAVQSALAELLSFAQADKIFSVNLTPSDRLPDYSEQTTDVLFTEGLSKELDGMEICSISRRKDFDTAIKNIEIAIGTDRCVYNFMKKRK